MATDDLAEQTLKVRRFVEQARDKDWQVQVVETTHIPFLPLPSWIVTTAYLGTSPHVKERIVRDLVVEKDWQLHMFDVTDIVNLNDRLRTK
jgi:hypothetical protein